jgi:hypothetical protein
MDSKKEKQISDIIQYFNRQVSNIFKVIDNNGGDIQNNPDIDWIRRITKIIRNENPSLMLEKSIDKLWDNKDKIIARDADFLVNKKITSKYIKDDSRKEWLNGIIDFIRNRYTDLTPEDTDRVWKSINNMLQAVIKYRILKDDFQL